MRLPSLARAKRKSCRCRITSEGLPRKQLGLEPLEDRRLLSAAGSDMQPVGHAAASILFVDTDAAGDFEHRFGHPIGVGGEPESPPGGEEDRLVQPPHRSRLKRRSPRCRVRSAASGAAFRAEAVRREGRAMTERKVAMRFIGGADMRICGYRDEIPGQRIEKRHYDSSRCFPKCQKRGARPMISSR